MSLVCTLLYSYTQRYDTQVGRDGALPKAGSCLIAFPVNPMHLQAGLVLEASVRLPQVHNLLQSPNLRQGLFYLVVISSESLGAMIHNFQHYFQVHLLYCCQINNKDLIYSVQSFIDCQSYPQVLGCQATQFLAALLSVSSLVLPDI